MAPEIVSFAYIIIIYVDLSNIFRNNKSMDFAAKVEETRRIWSGISSKFGLPKDLFEHQADAITLVLSGQHVFCCSPTGSGKTLAQLATTLLTSGTFFSSKRV